MSRKQTKKKELTPESVLRDLVKAVNVTGGVAKGDPSFSLPVYAPLADPDWLDMGDVYMKACQVLKKRPRIVKSEDE